MSLSTERIIEVACIELSHLKIVSVYRPPSGLYESFEVTMEQILSKICASNKKVIICGDFNINLLDLTSTSVRFTSLFQSYNLYSLFQEPTRVCETTATCIDNIITNLIPNKKEIISKLSSDHYGQIASFNIKCDSDEKKNLVFIPVTTKRIEQFRSKLNSNIHLLDRSHSSDEAFNKLFKVIRTQFDSIFTSKTVRNSNKKTKFINWTTKGIKISRKRLYDLYDDLNTSLLLIHLVLTIVTIDY